MIELTRRGFVLGAASAATAFYTAPAQATLMRGLPLPILVGRSERIVVLEPLETRCQYAEIGGRKSLVTDTRVRIHESWTPVSGPERESELVLRTLGGRLDGVAELVHGQPELELFMRGLAFLKRGRERSVWWAVGMAQGHFPLTGPSDAARLLANRNLPTIVNLETSAVRRLVGTRLSEARALVRQVSAP
jgi:hypothetical protein